MTNYHVADPRKPRRIAIFAAALLASFATDGPASADVPPASVIQKNYEVERMLAEGQQAIKDENFRAALIIYKNVVKAAPRNSNARVQLGVVLLRVGDDAGAERELRQARKDGAAELLVLPVLFDVMLRRNENQILLDQFPEPATDGSRPAAPDILKARALALQNLNKKTDALDAMDRSLALRRDWSGLLTRARLSFQQGDTSAAMKFADEAIAKTNSPDPMLSKAGMLLSANRSAEALDLANRLLAKFPNSTAGRFVRVEANLDLGKDAEAKAENDALLAKYPASRLGIFYRALLLARAGDHKGAWSVVQNLPADFRDSSSRLALVISQIAVQSGNAETGASILSRVLLKEPGLAAARLRLAAIRLQQNNPTAALTAIQPISDSANPLVIETLANIYLKQRRDQDALNALKRLDATTKGRADVKRSLGILEVRLGSIDQGIKDLTQAAASNPSDLSTVDPLINALVQRKRFAEALAVADRLGRDTSKRTASLVYRGGILFTQHDNAGAERAFNAAVGGDPKNGGALFARAQMLANLQRQDEALRDYRAVVAINGKNVPALIQIARIAERRGDDRAVRASLNQAITAVPDDMAPRFALMGYLTEQRRFAEAQTVAAAILQMQANNTDALAVMGRLQLALKQNKEAITTYRRMVSLMPTAPGPQVLLGNALSVSGDRAGAMRALDTAAKLSPKSAEINDARINWQFDQGNNDAAVALARAFQASNHDSAADVSLANALYRAGQQDEAIGLLNKSLADRPNTGVLISLTRFVQPSDPARAGALMAGWLAKYPADLTVRLSYASMLMTQQKNAEAIVQFQAALKQEPNNVLALNNLGWLLQTSDPKRALSLLTLAEKIAPNSPDVIDTLGWVKLQQKDAAGALPLLKKAHASKPEDGEITYHLAVALDANGQRDAARQMLKGLLASGAKFQGLPAAKELAAAWR